MLPDSRSASLYENISTLFSLKTTSDVIIALGDLFEAAKVVEMCVSFYSEKM